MTGVYIGCTMVGMKLTERDIDILHELAGYERGSLCGARPLDLGGYNGSHHSSTLAKLARYGLVFRSLRVTNGYSRASYRYRLTDSGRAIVDEAPHEHSA